MSSEKTRLSPFAFEISRKLPEKLQSGGRVLLAISGGEDSVALVPLFAEFEARFGLEVWVGHVHHGLQGQTQQVEFRQSCFDKVQGLALEKGWRFVANDPAAVTLSESADEEDFRALRQQCFSGWRDEFALDAIVTAHHRDDQLETRMIRMIRGTGADGVSAMKSWDGYIYRPFLSERKTSVLEYSKGSGYSGLADPSNTDERFLRNWLRKNWFESLEAHRPGALSTVMQSFDRVAEKLDNPEGVSDDAILFGIVRPAIDREIYRQMSEYEKEQILFRLLELQEPFRRMTLGQCHEVRKRLETQQKVLSFDVSGLRWQVNAERIEAVPS